jgi:hypothetical protein
MTEKLAVLVPPEPPEGSVFLDRLHRAWQRIGPVWFMAGTFVRPLFGPGPSPSLRWGQLLLDCGEGQVLWSPPGEPDTEPAAAAVADGQFVGFTRHGHPIGSARVPDDCAVRVPVVDCGGPAVCAPCGRDTVAIKELKAREIGASA